MGVSVACQKLSESRRGGGAPARAWVLLRRAADGVVRMYAARRRWGGARCCAKRLAWAGLSGKVASRRHPAATGYDSASYARNFDDGVWKAEEGGFWNSGSFATRFAHAMPSCPAESR